MLSPHEFATLMLINDGHAVEHLERAELETLRTRQLIVVERRDSASARASLTPRGNSVLLAAARMR
ncbi:hypothetical protein EVC45_38285 [Paraburkholderia sp. UYCP14C]|nr:hypothetical protein EVC45_38285 [Paraburkholderia sp. UYCP14C]